MSTMSYDLCLFSKFSMKHTYTRIHQDPPGSTPNAKHLITLRIATLGPGMCCFTAARAGCHGSPALDLLTLLGHGSGLSVCLVDMLLAKHEDFKILYEYE